MVIAPCLTIFLYYFRSWPINILIFFFWTSRGDKISLVKHTLFLITKKNFKQVYNNNKMKYIYITRNIVRIPPITQFAISVLYIPHSLIHSHSLQTHSYPYFIHNNSAIKINTYLPFIHTSFSHSKLNYINNHSYTLIHSKQIHPTSSSYKVNHT